MSLFKKNGLRIAVYGGLLLAVLGTYNLPKWYYQYSSHRLQTRINELKVVIKYNDPPQDYKTYADYVINMIQNKQGSLILITAKEWCKPCVELEKYIKSNNLDSKLDAILDVSDPSNAHYVQDHIKKNNLPELLGLPTIYQNKKGKIIKHTGLDDTINFFESKK